MRGAYSMGALSRGWALNPGNAVFDKCVNLSSKKFTMTFS